METNEVEVSKNGIRTRCPRCGKFKVRTRSDLYATAAAAFFIATIVCFPLFFVTIPVGTYLLIKGFRVKGWKCMNCGDGAKV